MKLIRESKDVLQVKFEGKGEETRMVIDDKQKEKESEKKK
jgi:hypothetical protein